ncbi:glycosyltransferase family 2 protein [Orbus wheelerorum]|uniref:glycosyltransferase family 2 protein n=1 Tax=Orbus wheelerorum TaxID=3074111 RepID=UPI00370D55F8
MEKEIDNALVKNGSAKEPFLVSILLSIYNVEKYLAECLDSLIDQTYTNLEIICVDNGSPDNSIHILHEYQNKDDRIKIVRLKENRKLCGGRNAGLDNATGEFICFVDPDDWVEKDHIKSMVEAIEQKDPDGKKYNLVVNYSAFNYLDNPELKKTNILYTYDRESGNYTVDDYNQDVRLDTDIPMWGRLYRRHFLEQHHIRFLDGFQTDNIPFTSKFFVYENNYFIISNSSNPNSAYWRRMLTPEGELTSTVLFKNLEIPKTLDHLYEYLQANSATNKVKVMFTLFFQVCFPAHKDQPRYYSAYKALLIKMEDDIKNFPSLYNQEDINLCNLIIYSKSFFEFCSLYFSPPPFPHIDNTYSDNIKLLGFIPLYRKLYYNNKIKYSVFGIPLWKIKLIENGSKNYLFGFLLLIKKYKKKY